MNNLIQPGDLIEDITSFGHEETKTITLWIIASIQQYLHTQSFNTLYLKHSPEELTLTLKCIKSDMYSSHPIGYTGMCFLSEVLNMIESKRWIVHKAFRNK